MKWRSNASDLHVYCMSVNDFMQKHNSISKINNHLVDTTLRGSFITLWQKCVLRGKFNSDILFYSQMKNP